MGVNRKEEGDSEDFAEPKYFCGACLRLAPPLDSTEILEWRGGDMVMAGETDPLMLDLVCPDCSDEEAPTA